MIQIIKPLNIFKKDCNELKVENDIIKYLYDFG